MTCRLVTLIILFGALTACSTITPYHPAKTVGKSGFYDQRIDDHRYRVTFTGNTSTPRETVEDYLLYRAAELTIEQGSDYFIITEKDTEAKKSYSTTPHRPAFYGRYYHYDGYHSPGFPYYAYGYDWGYPHEPDIHEFTRYSAIAYIALYSGTKPSNNPQAFTAKDVLKNLSSVVCADQEKMNCSTNHSH